METLSVSSPLFWRSLMLFLLIGLLYHLFSELSRGVWLSGGPPTYPFIGCQLAFYRNRRRLLDWYTELLSTSATGTIIVDRIGARRTVVTTNPDNVEYMLKTRFGNFPKGKSFRELLGDFLGKGIFNADGELWRVQRKLICHQFSARSLRQFTDVTLRDGVDSKLIPVLEKMAAENQVFDLQELLNRFTFDMICDFSLGVEHGSLDPDRPGSAISHAFDLSSMISALRGAAPWFFIWKIKRWLGVGSEKKLKESVRSVHDYINTVVRDRMEKTIGGDTSGHHINLDMLSRMLLDGHEIPFIRDMVVSFLMAGRDTTSAAMTWLFWVISIDSGIEEDLVREIRDLKGNNNMNYDSIKNLRFLQACLLESMRLYPPVVWDSKHAVADDLLPDGTRVWAGDRVTYFPYGMGRMEAVWGNDRFEFKPDRWFVEPDRKTMKKVCPFKYPVFQAGPRDCVGRKMAFAQMKYVVATILDRFEIKPVPSDKPVYVPLLTAHMSGGLPVRIHRRKKERTIVKLM